MLTVPNINREFGFTYVRMGEIDKAREVFEKMMDGNDEQKGMGFRTLALLSMYEGEFSEALGLMHESTLCYSLSGNKLSVLRNNLFVAVIYRTLGMTNELKKQLDDVNTVIGEVSSEPFWYLVLGNLYARNGDIEKAESILEVISAKITEGNRFDEAAYSQLKGEIELARGNNDEAIDLFETTIKLRNDSYTLSSLAYAYHSLGQLEKAISVYEDMIGPHYILGWEAQECVVEAYYNLARINEEMGNQVEAEKYYRQFTDIWKNADEDIPMLQDAKSRLASLETIIPAND
jgi:tetratricopeptide (TPR) repeat protein